jgi:hypothetical protein
MQNAVKTGEAAAVLNRCQHLGPCHSAKGDVTYAMEVLLLPKSVVGGVFFDNDP